MDHERALIKTGAGYIHYRACGQGPVVALFHIGSQSSALMVELMEGLVRQGLRAIAFDYPSHGQSDSLNFQPTIEQYAQWFLEALDSLGVETFTPMGEATGAVVAAELASLAPHRVERVVLTNVPYFERGEEWPAHVMVTPSMRPSDKSGFPLIRSIDFLLDVDWGHAPLKPDQSFMDRLNVAAIETGRNRGQSFEAIRKFDLQGTLERMQCPALVLLGEHFYRAEGREVMLSHIRDVRGDYIIKDARFCMTWEHAPTLADYVADFIHGDSSGELPG